MGKSVASKYCVLPQAEGLFSMFSKYMLFILLGIMSYMQLAYCNSVA